jgi:hypothetical protein
MTKASRKDIFKIYFIPIIKSVRALFFGGKNITEFLDRFEDLYADYDITIN